MNFKEKYKRNKHTKIWKEENINQMHMQIKQILQITGRGKQTRGEKKFQIDRHTNKERIRYVLGNTRKLIR